MAEITKFHERNVALFGKIETVVGTYVAPAAGDALAATTLTGSVTYETGSYTYTGDDLSRDEFTYQKDSYADVSVETPQQVLGALNGALTVADAPLSEWLQACGANITVLSAITDSRPIGTVIYDNATANDSSLSIDYRKTSAQDAVNQKLIKFNACRGMVDVTASVGDVPKLKFSLKGNAAVPEAAAKLVPNFGSQTSLVAAPVRMATIVTAKIAPAFSISSITSVTTTATVIATAHGLTTGNSVTISGATGVNGAIYNITANVTVTDVNTFTYTISTLTATATGVIMGCSNTAEKSFTFSTLQANNFFGFDYQRYITGAEEGFSKGAVATDVSMTILEDQAGTASFQPDANVSNFFAVKLKFGTAAGRYVTYRWNRLQLANVKEGKVASYFGRDISFRNTGRAYIILE